MSALDILRSGTPVACAPHGRFALSHFLALRQALAADPQTALIALWAEANDVFALLRDESSGRVALASAPAAGFAALSPVRPVAAWYERAIRDLWGHEAEGAIDRRPWLDHGAWEIARPMTSRPPAGPGLKPQPTFLPVAGDSLHAIPVGPVHAGIIEPGHFRFHAQGETIVRLEARLGYLHKGTLGLMRGKSPRAAARFAARISGDTTVAHSLAFARAAEAALGVAVPPRALVLRQVMLELERLANHCGDSGAIINDCSFVALAARFADRREMVLRATEAAFGHRLMMDAIVPGGVEADLLPAGGSAILAMADALIGELATLESIYDSHASLVDRTVSTGIVSRALADRFAAPGVVGRASGRARDLRVAEWPDFTAASRAQGDVDARLRVRLDEIAGSATLLHALLADVPPGEIAVPLPQAEGEGLGAAEGFRGECWHWLRLDAGGLIAGCFAADPSWRLWPLLEAGAIGNIVADFPLINKSINGSYSGVDL